ncbi:HD domain-containing protein [Gracilinema caldarium]|uniref:5'-deoxynucleotidase n=1 Tax=Gracilinema caldarium (strain ATCC 51460 / DSM 7334 / H1) TaxID=744872 RepID=F8EYJ3_GRAC1|nr:HD domain-containing protein [Gracilinema caldarium]AEJ18425.1 metal dependent phosphohydrolase [Gracilinema caldarium DSM 7334]
MKRKFHDGEGRLFRNRLKDQASSGGQAFHPKQAVPVAETGAELQPAEAQTASPPAKAHATATQATEAMLRSFIRMMDLKGLYRQGWLKRGVPENRAESVADHSFGTALLALLLAEQLKASPEFLGLNSHRCIEMALVHELGEVYVGDITPVDGVSREEKYVREREAFIKVVEGLPNRDRLIELWEDFEAGRSSEARFVRQLDRLEMGLQAALLKAEGYQRMDEFLESAHRTVSEPTLKALLNLAETKTGGTTI